MLKGIAVSQGYGIGKALVIKEEKLDYSSVEFTSVENEKQRFYKALEEFRNETQALISKSSNEQAEILSGHLAMLNDPFAISKIEEKIENEFIAEESTDIVFSEIYNMFSNLDDEFTKQRASDVRAVKNGILKALLGAECVDLSNIEKETIIVTNDITASMLSQIEESKISAIITEVGSYTSHSAILARAKGIPAIMSVENATERLINGKEIIVDGFEGKIIEEPTENEISVYRKKREKFIEEKEQLKQYLHKETVTKSGAHKKICGNIGSVKDVQSVLQNGGEGIGLFRTEFLFMEKNAEPTEQEQFEAYSSVLKAMNGKEVIIRTLDIGGDKQIKYLNIEKEDNPFLGFRAIRYCLGNREIFKRQIRAILRASQFGKAKILLPLVTNIQEVKKAKQLIAECEDELKKENLEIKKVPLGVMIETPSAALISDMLAKEVDFFSIGTNDLTGYIMAVDRGNSKVSSLYDTTQPSVLRAIEMTIKNAKKQGITVGMCGEAAADERIIPKLVEWGLDEFSVTSASILSTRKNICECE